MVQKNGGFKDIRNRIMYRYMKYRKILSILFDKKMLLKLKDGFYKIVSRPIMLGS